MRIHTWHSGTSLNEVSVNKTDITGGRRHDIISPIIIMLQQAAYCLNAKSHMKEMKNEWMKETKQLPTKR